MENNAKNAGAQGEVKIDQQNNYFNNSAPPPLPSNIPKPQDFIGREDNLKALRGWYAAGKTEIAKKFADEIKADYDAHIFIDLRGAGGNPLPTADAMWQVISLFNPESQRPQIPLSDPRMGREFTRAEQNSMELQVLQSQYIDMLNKHNVLLVLDNAKDENQIALFNKLNGDCLLITTRHRLYLDGCEVRNVEEMSPEDAVKMLERKLGNPAFCRRDELYRQTLRLSAFSLTRSRRRAV